MDVQDARTKLTELEDKIAALLELHFLWWIIRLGSRDPVCYCASCESEIGEQDTVCGKCGAEFGEAIE
jgi:predicted amidophosphoribosyltransferase